MKELIYRLTVYLLAVLLFAYGYSSSYPIHIEIPSIFSLSADISYPLLAILLVGLVSLQLKRFRFHEPFVKPYKGFDKNFKVLYFNVNPLLTAYCSFNAILNANNHSFVFAFISLAFAYIFYLQSCKRGFHLVQSWYESPEGKLLRIVRM